MLNETNKISLNRTLGSLATIRLYATGASPFKNAVAAIINRVKSFFPKGKRRLIFISFLALPITPLLYFLDVHILINCRTNGIGHLAIEPGGYLAQQALQKKKNRRRPILIPFWGGQFANSALAQCLKKYFVIPTSPLLQDICRAIGFFPYLSSDIGVAPILPGQPYYQRIADRNIRHKNMSITIQNYRKKFTRPLIKLPEEMIAQGLEVLRKMGISQEDRYVCLHASEVSENGLYGYDLYRRQKLNDFIGAIETVTKLGGKIVRMGDNNLTPSPPHLPIIDYACSKHKSDWMDLVLISQCRYFIGCNSGLQSVAVLFGKPQIITNVIPWPMLLTFDGDIFIPKMITNKNTNSLLSIAEYLKESLHLWQKELPEPYEAIANGEEELSQVISEMEKHLATPDKDIKGNYLQKQWKDAFPPGSQCHYQEGRISTFFIKKYENVLFANTLTTQKPG